ncbi:Proteophosphoglycan ppg4 [Leucosporidium creatinivorum]|uniref:Proteophosphoglycan ppg4 n=1 Tax=Leucosporidium creatinivorum TaxID=106004 RepID=A0A1Y2E5T6_9BASI|nr:Proteophosphoglycan ppg4 [Leucosporidium creatinivorum]
MASSPRADSTPYYGAERLVLSIDIGNSFSSVSLQHLTFGCIPANNIRTVASYPSFPTSTSIPPLPSRHPSAIYYDRRDQARAFGAEVTTPLARERAKAEGWILVERFKLQMKPPPPSTGKREGKEVKKLAKKSKPPPPSASLNSLAASSTVSVDSAGLLTAPGAVGSPLTRSVTPESLVDAAMENEGWEVLEEPSPSVKGGKKMMAYEGPRLATIYAALLKHLVACAHAWFAETTPSGEEIFVRLWSSAIFILTHPADWGSTETAQLREGMEQAGLLPKGFEVGRLVFVKEPTATVFFARRHTRNADSTWLKEGASFAICDAAECGTSIMGFTVSSHEPKLKLRAYEAVSRLPVGASTVTSAFSSLLSKRLGKSKFNKPNHVQVIMDEFEIKVKTKFSRAADVGEEGFRLRIASEGEDKSAGISGGCMRFSGQEIEDLFRPTVDAIIVRLSSILPRGSATSILLSGGFGESPYVQSRLSSAFTPSGISLIIPEIPSHTAVAEGAARFYFSESVGRRKCRFEIGISTAVGWSENWEMGMEREIFTSVSGTRYILGKWTAVVKQGTVLDPFEAVEKVYNVKHVLSSTDTTLSVDLFAHDPASEPATDGWMTDLKGTAYSSYTSLGTVSTDLASLVAISPVRGAEEGKQWAQLDLKLIFYVGKSSLEACVSWEELGKEKRGEPIQIPDEYW